MRGSEHGLACRRTSPALGFPTKIVGGYPLAGPVSTARPSAFHLSKPPSSTATLSKPERSQHPPEPRRPHHGADAVEHHAIVGADAMAAERGLELAMRRHHEAQLRLLIGEFALQIEKIRAGNMPGLEGVGPGTARTDVAAAVASSR